MPDGSATLYQVKALDEATAPAWDAFVEACPEATFFHKSGWKRVIERTFGHRCPYLYAEAGGVIRGVLPLTHIASPLFGRSLVSNGFCVYGGPAAADEGARSALDEAATALAATLKVDHLEYRLRSPSPRDWPQRADLYATFRKPLDPDPEKNLLAIPRKQRAMVRKGIKGGLLAEEDGRIDRFFPLYAESVRNLGTPVFSKRLFANLKAEFGHDCQVLIVTHEGRPLTGLISFFFRDEVLPYYGGGTADARHFAAYDFMYWEAMRRAVARGCRVFDFGRSKRGTGAFAFKTHWGFEPESLHYTYKLFRRSHVPDINPLNPKYRLAIGLWKRLPLAVANRLGPPLARQLG